MYIRLLHSIVIMIYFFSFALGQTNVESQYLSNDEYWYATGEVKKSIGSKYKMEARNIALSGIASQISSTITALETKTVTDKSEKRKDYGIAEEVYSITINNEIEATIEFDIEDVEKKLDGRIFRHTIRLNKEKYFKNRKEKRDNAIKKSIAILSNIDPFPSKSAINNLNDIVLALLPYSDEDLQAQIQQNTPINVLGYSISLARNYIDRIVFDVTIDKYPLINISDELLIDVHVYDRKTNMPLSQFAVIDVTDRGVKQKSFKTYITNNQGKIQIEDAAKCDIFKDVWINDMDYPCSNRSYIIDLQSVFPSFIAFDLDEIFTTKGFVRPRNVSFNFKDAQVDKNIYKLFWFNLLTEDIIVKLSEKYNAIFDILPKQSDFDIVIDASFSKLSKNEWGIYVCFMNVTYSLINKAGEKMTSHTVKDIRGTSVISSEFAIRDASEKISKEYVDEILSKFSKAIHSY
jgi:hypothetical protein